VKPRLLDFFCGAGGATRGYQEAGFYVVGVDIKPQPNYCGDEFIQADAIEWLDGALEGGMLELGGFDAIHASPPCQAFTGMNRRHAEARAAHPKLIAPTRGLLQSSGLPYVIENVGGAIHDLLSPSRLCGRALGLPIHRHRLFETSFSVLTHQCPGGREVLGVYGKLDGRRLWTRADGTELRAPKTLEEAAAAMGIDWMTWDELRESIPPVMTKHIGTYLLTAIQPTEKASTA
jgi:DNA (cytosine-5)-methyltransferase 1